MISATGQGRDKRYNVAAMPGRRRKENVDKVITAAWEAAQTEGFAITALTTGGDPFTGTPF